MFTSSKVNLRKVTIHDLERYHSWRNDVEVMTSTSFSLDVYNEDETRDFFENVILKGINSKSYIIEEATSKTPVGITSLINIDYKNRNAELIIDIGEKDYWGKGIATHALRELVTFSFSELNIHRLYLKVFSFNEAAIHLYSKLGFKQEGISREALYRKNQWHDVIHMGILKHEWISH